MFFCIFEQISADLVRKPLNSCESINRKFTLNNNNKLAVLTIWYLK